MYKPLQITANMNSPVAYVDIIMFDSLLAASVAIERNMGQLTNEEDIQEFELPLEKSEPEGVWLASAGFMAGIPGKAIYHKKWDEENDEIVATGKSKIVVTNGVYKSYSMPIRYIDTNRIYFWAIGEKDEIQQKLAKITAIGKKRSQGYGAVDNWEIEPSKITREQIFALRPVPKNGNNVKMKPLQYIDMQIRRTPPYWALSDAVVCSAPVPLLSEEVLCSLLQAMQYKDS
jgi:CRISPR type IV-associated protein Csf3